MAAATDSLTGLANHRHFQDELRAGVQESRDTKAHDDDALDFYFAPTGLVVADYLVHYTTGTRLLLPEAALPSELIPPVS